MEPAAGEEDVNYFTLRPSTFPMAGHRPGDCQVGRYRQRAGSAALHHLDSLSPQLYTVSLIDSFPGINDNAPPQFEQKTEISRLIVEKLSGGDMLIRALQDLSLIHI